MKAIYGIKLCVLTLGLLASPALHAEGTHGGDGRLLNKKVIASYEFVTNLRPSVRNYLRSLRDRTNFLDADWEHSEFKILTSDELLKDVEDSPPYNIVKVRGGCGYLADGFPRTASTLNSVPFASICIDLNTAQDLSLTASQLAGIVVHEHIRHLKGSLDRFHNWALATQQTYWNAQSPIGAGTCKLEKSSGVHGTKSDELDYDPSELLTKQQVISKLLVGQKVSIAAQFVNSDYVRRKEVKVTITYNDKKFSYTVRSIGNDNVNWIPADFDLNVTPIDSKKLGRETYLHCGNQKIRLNAPFRGSRLSPSLERDWDLPINPETHESEFTGFSKIGSDQ